jgi:hypothetical protein
MGINRYGPIGGHRGQTSRAAIPFAWVNSRILTDWVNARILPEWKSPLILRTATSDCRNQCGRVKYPQSVVPAIGNVQISRRIKCDPSWIL